MTESIRHRIDSFTAHNRDPAIDAVSEPIVIDAQPPTTDVLEAAHIVTASVAVTVRREGSMVLFDQPGNLTWCNYLLLRSGICLDPEVEPDLDFWSTEVLPYLLIELASSRGWFGVEAAAMARGGRCIVLPGPTGSARSTAVEQASEEGWSLVCNGFVWIRPDGDRWRVLALSGPTGMPPSSTPSVDDVPLVAIVYPELEMTASPHPSRLEAHDSLVRLRRQMALVTLGAGNGDRFEALLSIVKCTPAYRLRFAATSSGLPPALVSILEAAPEAL